LYKLGLAIWMGRQGINAKLSMEERPVQRLKMRWEGNTKEDLRELEFEDLRLMQLAQDSFQ
jgi:hypothetical protein